MKVLIAEFAQEGNSFCKVVPKIVEGEQRILLGDDNSKAAEIDGTAIRGFYEVLKKYNADIHFSACVAFGASGYVTDETTKIIMDKILHDISVFKPEIIMMSLHGAMIIESQPDGSGYVLEEIRKAAGKDCVIGATTDMHANMTPRMLANADYIVGYKTYPHIDLKERAIESAELAISKFKLSRKDACAQVKLPMIFPAERGDTSAMPLVKLMDRAAQMEKEDDVLSITISCVQPWMNVDHVGCSAVVYALTEEKAAAYAQELGGMLWGMRKELQIKTYTVDEAMSQFVKVPGKPALFVFSADSPSAGASSDSVAVIRDLLKYADKYNIYANIIDAPVAGLAVEKGEGAVIDVDLGHSITREFGEPLRHTWEVERICEEVFEFKGPMYTGTKQYCGKSAVLRYKNLHVLVMEGRVDNCDPEMYNFCGLPVEKADILSLRSANGYKAPYAGLYKQDFIMSYPGATSPKLDQLPFNNTGWEIYPINKNVEYTPKAQLFERR